MDFGTLLGEFSNWLVSSGLRIVLIIVGVWLGLKFVHLFIHRVIEQAVTRTYRIQDDKAIEKRVSTIHRIVYSALHIVAWIVVALIVLSELGIDIGPLLAAAGVAGFAIGFGAQYLIRDLIAGLFIILEDQFRKGDVVKIGGIAGLVEDITLRKTVLRDLDGIEHHVPNGEINTTSNYTKLWSRVNINIGIAYESNLEKAIEILDTIGQEMAETEPWKSDMIKPIKALGVEDFGDSAVVIKVLGDTKPSRQWDVMREYRKRVKIAFDKNKIDIPYPHRTIITRK